MEAPDLLENGNIPPKRKLMSYQVPFCILVFVLIMTSVLVSVVFTLLLQKQAPGSCWVHGSLKSLSSSTSKGAMRWELNLEHCDGAVQKDRDQYLIIEQNGNYFIYAQVNRIRNMSMTFTLEMYKEPEILLNKAVGPNTGDTRGTVNFGRPFFLQKGDKLYCEGNFNTADILAGNQSYWGLYKI